jgi:hypothetical protein
MFPMIMQAGSQLIGGVIGGMHAARQASRAKARASAAASAIADIKRTRGPVPDPYANFENLADMAQDLSRNMTNPMANLAVATQAAEMQAEEADIALANTLDTLRATGAGAGGATALAQAALRSKKGIAASIETQEAQNEKLRAQGQANLEARVAAEQARIQGVQIGEAQRIQEAEAAGTAYQFEGEENRRNADIARHHDEYQRWSQAAMGYEADKSSAFGGLLQTGMSMFAPGGLFAK